jgi:adenine-specific DNA-methyltransferase
MAKDYSKLDKTELISIIERLESRKKYGLVWDEERDKEKFEIESENAIPVLKEIKNKAIKVKNSKITNIIIEGDNYHALTVLNYTHQEKIDVIYIDPPYNTGANDWKYNNNYVDKTDTYRHSKWLSMMKNRLQISKKLLKPDGVLICAIDENEFNRLGLLLEEIFSNNELHCITVIHNPRGVQGKDFSYNHEYVYFSFPTQKLPRIGEIKRPVALEEELRDHGGESERSDAKNCFYPILVKNNKIIGFGDVPPVKFHPKGKNVKRKDNVIEVWPIDVKGIERKWVFARNTVHQIQEKLFVVDKGKSIIDIYRTKDTQRPRTVWGGWKEDTKYDASTFGSKIVAGLTGTKFPFPKSIYNTLDCLECVIKDNKDAIILDFFAGSGTTGHAVSLINKADNGNRQFILCTNNENNIAEEVTYPRIKAVIKGHKDYPEITGIESNLKYYKSAFVKSSSNRDELKMRITQNCTELLCIRESIFNEYIINDDYHIYQDDDRVMAIYYALDMRNINKLKKDLDKLEGEKILYCFTLDSIGLSSAEFDGWQGIKLEAIPQKIIDLYQQIYEF